MKYLLDTNIVIYALTGVGEALKARMGAADLGDLRISAISWAEIRLGLARGRAPSAATLDRFRARVPVLPFDEAAALAYATQPFRRASFDRLIAAHALAAGLTLITANTPDFADIEGLRVEDWTA